MRCVLCKSKDVRKFEGCMSGFCPVCGKITDIEDDADAKVKQSMQIFFSYGHDTHQEFVARLAEAIMQKTDNRIKVWIDNEDIHEHTNWRERITDGILNSRSVLAFLSQYSAREKGVCLDELAIALSSKHGMIKTVLLEKANTFTPPALVTEYQWADMSNYKEYAAKGEEAFAEYIDRQADRIIHMLDSDEVTQYNNELSLLRKKLALPEISYEPPRLNRLLLTKMVGRTWLTDMVNAWITDANAKPVLMLYGKPGAGKSMFSAHLQHYNPHVAASFACNHQSDEFSNTDNIITWLAYKLAMRLPDYRRQLLKLFDDQFFDAGSKRDRFDRLIAQPLSLCIDGNRAPMMIIIDALDEAKGDEMAGFISDYISLLPPWLRILITARKEPHITERFKNYPHIDFAEQSENNEADILEYYTEKLSAVLGTQSDREAALQRLLTASEGVFLYAEEICPILLDESKNGNIDLLAFDLPQGMDNLFHFSMKRKDFTYYKDGKTYHYTDFWREALGMIVAAPSPLPVETLKTLMNWDENDLHTFRLPLSALLTETDGCLQTFHRSFGEWLDKTGEFHSSTQDGLVNLANRSYAVYQTGVDNLDTYLLCNLIWLVARNEMFEAYIEIISNENIYDAIKGKAVALVSYKKFADAISLLQTMVYMMRTAYGRKHQNNLSETIWAYNEIIAINRKRIELQPYSPENLFSLAKAIKEAASSLWYYQKDESLLLFSECLEIGRYLANTYFEKLEYEKFYKDVLICFALYVSKTDIESAINLYQEYIDLFRKQVKAFPQSATFKEMLSNVLIRIADVIYKQKAVDNALCLYEEAIIVDRQLVASHPNDLQYSDRLLCTLKATGHILEEMKKYNRAIVIYEEMLNLDRMLSVMQPEKERSSGNLELVADFLFSIGKCDDAIVLYNEAVNILRDNCDSHPDTAILLYDFATYLEYVANILANCNNKKSALLLLEESLELRLHLAINHPQNPLVQLDFAHILKQIISWEKSDITKNKICFLCDTCISALRQMAHDYNYLNYWIRLLYTLNVTADYLKNNNILDALLLFEESLHIARYLVNCDAIHPQYKYDLSNSLCNVAEILKFQDKKDEALPLYEESIELLEYLCEQFPQDLQYIQDLAVAYYNYGISSGDAAFKEKAYAIVKQYPDLPKCKSIPDIPGGK